MSPLSRRSFVSSGAGLLAGAPLLAAPARSLPRGAPAQPPGLPGRDYRPVVTPDGATLPWTLVDGVKVMHLVAEPVHHEFAPGLVAEAWGYNGRVHGPTIELVEGDRVRIHVTNRLPAATSVHWHGLIVPNGMDGVAGLTQRAIAPGETFRYEFTLRQHGTFLYHSHHDEALQMALGLMGLLVVHPRRPVEPPPERDYAFLLSEWKLAPGARRPDPSAMSDFNLLTLNGRVFPGTTPMVAATGERVRVRLGNLSAVDHHPIHLHGLTFQVTATDGGEVPASARLPETTVLVPVGATRTLELVPEEPGDWPVHCHMTHHVMNQMGHGLMNTFGVETADLDARLRRHLPGFMSMGTHGMAEMGSMTMPGPENSLAMVGGTGPFGPLPMGGMFTLLRVRDGLTGSADPGPYAHPLGSVAEPSTAAELERDGIVPGASPSVPPPPAHEAHDAHAHHGHH